MLFYQYFKFPWRQISAAIIASVMLGACTTGDDPDYTAPEIEITSPLPGSNVTGSNAITLQGIDGHNLGEGCYR